MKKYVILMIAASIFLSSCGKTITPIVTPAADKTTEPGTEQATVIEAPTDASVSADTKTTEPAKAILTATAPTKSYTSAEVATHNNGKSCWLILEGRVFDVTNYISKHPGGDSILRGCGKDATQMFSRHPESAKAMKEQFYIGDLK